MALKLILALTVVPLASCSRLPPLRGLAQVRLDDAWLQRPVGPRRVAPGQKPPDSGNITAVKALDDQPCSLGAKRGAAYVAYAKAMAEPNKHLTNARNARETAQPSPSGQSLQPRQTTDCHPLFSHQNKLEAGSKSST